MIFFVIFKSCISKELGHGILTFSLCWKYLQCWTFSCVEYSNSLLKLLLLRYIFFRQITTFIKVLMAFAFGLHWIYQLKGLKPKNKDNTNFYECCDLMEKVYLLLLYTNFKHEFINYSDIYLGWVLTTKKFRICAVFQKQNM